MNKNTQKHSYHIVLLLFVVLIAGSVGVGLFVQQNPLIKAFDGFFYELIHEGYHATWLDFLIAPFNYNFLPDSLSPLHMPSYFYFMFMGTMLYLALFKRSLVGWALFCFVFGTILSLAVSALDWHFVFRQRPFWSLTNTVDDFGRMAWGKLSSYPSGHARETALYSTIIASFIPQLKWILVIFVIFIGYSRVYIGAHYPTDAIAGILIGYLTAKVILIVARELQLMFQKGLESQNHDKRPKGASSDIIKS